MSLAEELHEALVHITELERQQNVLSVIVSQAIALHPEWEAAKKALAAVKSVAMFNGMTEAETNTTASVAGLAARKTCAARGFMFGNDDACWFYCVGGGCGSDEPCEHQQPAGQEGSDRV